MPFHKTKMILMISLKNFQTTLPIIFLHFLKQQHDISKLYPAVIVVIES